MADGFHGSLADQLNKLYPPQAPTPEQVALMAALDALSAGLPDRRPDAGGETGEVDA